MSLYFTSLRDSMHVNHFENITILIARARARVSYKSSPPSNWFTIVRDSPAKYIEFRARIFFSRQNFCRHWIIRSPRDHWHERKLTNWLTRDNITGRSGRIASHYVLQLPPPAATSLHCAPCWPLVIATLPPRTPFLRFLTCWELYYKSLLPYKDKLRLTIKLKNMFRSYRHFKSSYYFEFLFLLFRDWGSLRKVQKESNIWTYLQTNS